MPNKKNAALGKSGRKSTARKVKANLTPIAPKGELGQSFTPERVANGNTGGTPQDGKSAIQRKKMTFGDSGATFSWRVLRIMAEFVDGFEFLSKLRRTVTIFGSARLQEDSPYYQLAQTLARRLAEERYTVVTGGGPGIMEAENRGAAEGQGRSRSRHGPTAPTSGLGAP